MAKVIHYEVGGEVPCKKKGALKTTKNINEITCKRCLNRLENNPNDPCNKTSKKCLRCEEVLPLDCFWNSKSELDGKVNNCSKCIRTEKGTYFEPEILPEDHKKCNRCEEIKSFSEFSPRKDGNAGYTSWCRKCNNEVNRPKKIHYWVDNKPFCGNEEFVKYSENIKEVTCRNCLKIYNEEIDYLEKDGLKKCRKCEQVLSVDKFLNNSHCKDGKDNWCRVCKLGPYKEKEIFPEGYKRCTKCGELKEFSEYYKLKKGKFGLGCSCKECNRKFVEENRESISAKQREYYLNNKEKVNKRNNKNYQIKKEIVSINGKRRRMENPEKQKEKHLKWSNAIARYSTYADRLTVEEDAISKNSDELWCRCAYCREYHPVTNLHAKNRATSLSGREGGENRIYCSDRCKELCPIFGQSKYPKGFKNYDGSRCNQVRVRQILLDIQIDEFGFNFCDECGENFEPEDLYFHHNLPVSDEPNEYDNASHYVLKCKKHHEHRGCLGRKYE